MQKFIPYEKLSKKKKRELDSAKRGSWHGVSPVTKRIESKKQYDRKKALKWKDELPFQGFLLFLCGHLLVQFLFHFVQRDEEPVRGDHRAAQQHTEDVPTEHVPPRRVRTFHAKRDRFRFQLLRDSRHPNQRIDEQRRDAEQVGLPVGAHLVTEHRFQLRLQTAERHIQQEEQSGAEEVDKAEQKPAAVGVFETHNVYLE